MIDAVPANRRTAKISHPRRAKLRAGLNGRRIRPEKAIFLLVRKLEKRLDRLRDPNLEAWQLAQEVMRILRLLLAHETGKWDVSEAASVFSASLWAGPVVSDLIHDLNQRCAAILYRLESIAVQDYESAEMFMRDLQTLLSWYLSRKMLLTSLDKDPSGFEDEGIFDYEFLTDVRHQGLVGLQAKFAARLIGRSAQPLWARLQLRDTRGPVGCRSGWESWTDTSGTDPRAAVLQHLVPDAQRRVVDGISLFLPYAALDLQEGRNDLIAEVVIVDSDDVPVAATRRKELIYVSSAERTAPMRSPQSNCIWTADPISGDTLTNICMAVSRDSAGSDRLVISFDLGLHGHEGEAVTIELRLIDEHGEMISATEDSLADERGGLLVSETVFPRSPIVQHRGMTFDLPVYVLELSDPCVRIDCEVSVSDTLGRLICGATVSMTGNEIGRGFYANPFTRSGRADFLPRLHEATDRLEARA